MLEEGRIGVFKIWLWLGMFEDLFYMDCIFGILILFRLWIGNDNINLNYFGNLVYAEEKLIKIITLLDFYHIRDWS